MNDSQSKTAGSERDWLVIINNKPATAQSMLAALIDIYDDTQNNAPEHRCYVESAWGDCLRDARALLATLSHPATQAGAVQAVAWELPDPKNGYVDVPMYSGDEVREIVTSALAATQPNAAPAAEVVALPTPVLCVSSKDFKRMRAGDDHIKAWLPPTTQAEDMALFTADQMRNALAAPAAAIDAREQEAPTFSCHLARDHGCAPCASGCGKLRCMYPSAPSAAPDPELVTVGAMHKCRTGAQFDQCVNCGAMAEELAKPCKSFLTEAATNSAALASPSESPAARPNAAGQEQGERDA